MRIYIDTSVINGLYAQDAIWIKEATQGFFKSAQRQYKLYISDLVANEIKRTRDVSKRENLLDVIKKYNCAELTRTEEVEKLALMYIKHKIMPQKYLADAVHIAIASVYKIPVLVSWNFKHIVRHKTRIGINSVNTKYGYIQIDICSPEEVA